MDLYERCPWLRPGWEEPAEDREKKRRLAERDWLAWYGETFLPAAKRTAEGMERASSVGRMLASEGWNPDELAALFAERAYLDL